jgi:hypothetical protein
MLWGHSCPYGGQWKGPKFSAPGKWHQDHSNITLLIVCCFYLLAFIMFWCSSNCAPVWPLLSASSQIAPSNTVPS